jgi:hypothetical protein
VAGSSPIRQPNSRPAYSNLIQINSSTISGTLNSSNSTRTWVSLIAVWSLATASANATASDSRRVA